jgi:hypothetical protein
MAISDAVMDCIQKISALSREMRSV